MSAEKVIDVIAYAAPPKDAKGNLIKGDDGKTIKGEVLGKDITYEYSLNRAGLDAAVKRDGIETVIENHNRQKKTDCRNAIASEAKRDADPEKKIKRDIGKVSKKITEDKRKELNTELATLLAKYENLDKE